MRTTVHRVSLEKGDFTKNVYRFSVAVTDKEGRIGFGSQLRMSAHHGREIAAAAVMGAYGISGNMVNRGRGGRRGPALIACSSQLGPVYQRLPNLPTAPLARDEVLKALVTLHVETTK